MYSATKLELFLFLEKIYCIIFAGGHYFGRGGSAVDSFTGDIGAMQLPTLPKEIHGPSMVLHNGNILLCGGYNNEKTCYQLIHATWKQQSTLNEGRVMHSAVATQSATFIFGGRCSSNTYEYLPKDSTSWLMGKSKIPNGFWNGFAIGVKSNEEIWLIGGTGNQRRILSFNVNDHTFRELPSRLNLGRTLHRCAFIPNTNKVMVTGAYNSDSTEIIDTTDESVIMGGPMNSKRRGHGMDVITIDGEERLAVFGGEDLHGRVEWRNELDSVELYNNKTKKWEITHMKLREARSDFGFLKVVLADILAKI